MPEKKTRKVVFCTPSLSGPTAPYIASLKAAIPAVEAAGWEHGLAQEIGNAYISAARSFLIRKALDAKPSVLVFIDYDMSFKPDALMKLLETEGDVVAGTYRFKDDVEEYMGSIDCKEDGTPIVRADGCVRAHYVPAGFLKITTNCIDEFMVAYPHLVYGTPHRPSIDLFNHGAYKGQWFGEDYAFSRNWRDRGGEAWIIPDLTLVHNAAYWEDGVKKYKAYPGNFHNYLRRQPGGDLEGQA